MSVKRFQSVSDPVIFVPVKTALIFLVSPQERYKYANLFPYSRESICITLLKFHFQFYYHSMQLKPRHTFRNMTFVKLVNCFASDFKQISQLRILKIHSLYPGMKLDHLLSESLMESIYYLY